MTDGRNAIFSGPPGTRKTLVIALAYRARLSRAATWLRGARCVGGCAHRGTVPHVVHDGDLAEAILERLLEGGTHFEMRGRSYRTRHLKKIESVDTTDA